MTMPDPNQIDPYYLRERGLCETDEQFADRMKALDRRDEFMRSLFLPRPPHQPTGE
jgi:hypothetical protein